MKLEITKDEYITALLYLDMLLKDIGEHMSIKAIGGFALLWHSVRGTGYTADIDSLTADFKPEVIACIEEAARVMDLPEDWVNNYNVLENDVESIEIMLDPFWERASIGAENIQLWIADLETLLRSKLMAAEDSELTGRAQDFPDLMDIFSKIGCFSLRACQDYTEENLFINLPMEYPNVVKMLGQATFPLGTCLTAICASQRGGINVCMADKLCPERTRG
jgi:hypothetical protein